MAAREATRPASSVGLTSYMPQIWADHGRSSGRSASGTPSRSLITATDSGSATSATRSPPPASASRSTSRSTFAWTRPRSRSTIRGVNALATSRRSRVWSGGSRSSMPLRIRCQNGARYAGSSGRPISAWLATCR